MLTPDPTIMILIALLALWPAAVFGLLWRLMNSHGRVEWSMRTFEPERRAEEAEENEET